MTKQEFLKGVANWNNHLYLMWPALYHTSGLVVEFGCGHGSTKQLHDYCEGTNRNLISYENNLEWLEKFNHLESESHKFYYVKDWDSVNITEIGVLLIDHAPGERRKFDIAKYANNAKIVVCHDTEPAADHGYQMRGELKKFKYQVDYESVGAWATAVSNFIDVRKFINTVTVYGK